MKKYNRDVFVLDPATERTVGIIHLESDTSIDAYDALKAAGKHMEEKASGTPCQLKVYCGGAN